MSIVLDILSWILLISGGLISVVSAIGVMRLPGLFARMHSATIIDMLGAGLVLSGLMIQAGFTVVCFKLLLVFLLLMVTTSAAAHALAKAALADGVFPHRIDADEVRKGLAEAVHGTPRHPNENHPANSSPKPYNPAEEE